MGLGAHASVRRGPGALECLPRATVGSGSAVAARGISDRALAATPARERRADGTEDRPVPSEPIHQSMHTFVANTPWDDCTVLAVARDYAPAEFERHAHISAWVVGDTGGFRRRGQH